MVYGRRFSKRKFGRKPYRSSRKTFSRFGKSKKRMRQVARGIAKSEIKKTFELRTLQTGLPTYFTSVGTSWRVAEMYPSPIESASATGMVGRGYRPLRIFTKNALLIGGASGTTGIDDYYNMVRIMIVETDGFEGDGAELTTKLSGISMNTIASKKAPFVSLPRFASVLTEKTVLLKTLGDPDGAGYVPIPKRFNINVKLSGQAYQTANTPAVYDRRFWFCMLTDSGLNPSPSITNGNLYFMYQDDC